MTDVLLAAIVFVTAAALGAALCAPPSRAIGAPSERRPVRPPAEVAIGTVRTVGGLVTLDVERVSGHHFVGRLNPPTGEGSLGRLHPGVVLLVTFDPSQRERLSLADDMAAVRAAFDQMLVRKGLATPAQVGLIRYGTRARGIVTAIRTTGTVREDFLEVELDLMVQTVAGTQFPAHETALVPASALANIAPGSVIDTYHHPGDESVVAVSVPPG